MPKPNTPKPNTPKPNTPKPNRRSAAIVTPVEDGSEQFQFDGTDIFLGILLMILIPTVTYGALSVAGLSPGGRGVSIERGAELAEMERNKLKADPPMIRAEFNERMAHVTTLLRTRAPKYLRRAVAEEKNVLKDKWLTCAKSVLQHCKTELKHLQGGIAKSADLKDPAYRQRVSSRLKTIEERSAEVEKVDPFSGIRGH